MFICYFYVGKINSNKTKETKLAKQNKISLFWNKINIFYF